MAKFFIRLFSFFGKEFNEIRRQPRLVLSLLLGPLLILFLFGVGYKGSQPLLRTAIVLPPGDTASIDPAIVDQASKLNFELISVDSDRETAMRRLRDDELDVVQVMPDNIQERLARGEQAPVAFVYNDINPLNEQWIQYLAYAEVVELNRALLLDGISVAQTEARGSQSQLAETRQQLEQVDAGLQGSDPAALQESLRRLRAASGILLVSALLAQPGADGTPGSVSRQEIVRLQEDLDSLDQAISDGQLDQQRERVKTTLGRITELEKNINLFTTISPTVIASPLQQTFENINGRSYDLTIFYAPGIVALIIQHIGVTLGSLSLVRERVLGATEIFQIAPISSGHMFFGKYLAYLLFIGIMIALLTGLLRLLGVPFLGDPLSFALAALLLTLAGLGLGFLISSLSRSDSQAVQLSMLVLLLSIFFGGFFLPLESFYPAARWVSYILPLTHGVAAFQALMLQGQAPAPMSWIALSSIALVCCLGALFFWSQGTRRRA